MLSLKKILVAAAAVGLMGMASSCVSPVRAVPTPTPWPTPITTEKALYIVERAPMIDRFRLNGQVVPEDWTLLSFPVAGELAAFSVDKGDEVQEGEIVAELESGELQDALEQATLTLEQAQDALTVHRNRLQFDLERARLEERRAQILLDQARTNGDETEIALRTIDLDLAQLSVRQIEAGEDPTLARSVAKAQLAVTTLEQAIEERRLRAPFSGQVVAVGIGVDNVQGSATPPRPPESIPALAPVVLLARPAPLLVIVAADSPRATELSMGQAVTVTHAWAKDDPIPAQVTALPVTLGGGRLRPGFPNFVHIGLPEQHPPMAIGDFVDVNVLAAVHEDTLVLPDAAVRRFAGRTFVVLQEGERLRRVDIKTGLESDGLVEVAEGLQAGDAVVGR